jgi:REP element-mobilizing transposase RayT
MADKQKYSPAIHDRRSIRLQNYDYTGAGAYFITICTHNRKCMFGQVGAGSKPALSSGSNTAQFSDTQSKIPMILNKYGEIVIDTWEDLVNHITGIELDAFVIMLEPWGCCQGGFRTRPYGASESIHGLLNPINLNAPTTKYVCLGRGGRIKSWASMADKQKYSPAIHDRRSIRLQNYDYTGAGAYFITICTHNRKCMFGQVGAGSKPAQLKNRLWFHPPLRGFNHHQCYIVILWCFTSEFANCLNDDL